MSQPRHFFAADTHLSHRLMERTRPFETLEKHDSEIIGRWNAVVRENDIVWHLGDCVMNRHAMPLLGQLRGRKRLVMGNHDVHPIGMYLEYFEKIFGAVEFRGCLLTHIPVDKSQHPRFRANIHGHTHELTLPDPFHVCVSMEQIDYAPIVWEKLEKRIGEG